MKNSILSSLVLAFGLLTLGGNAVADDAIKFKLVPSMKLSPTFRLPPVIVIPPYDKVGALCSQCKAEEAHARKDHDKLMAQYKVCKNKAYSQAEQTAAGCKNTDTVAQCNAKLFRNCTKAARTHYDIAYHRMIKVCTNLINEVKAHMAKFHPHH